MKRLATPLSARIRITVGLILALILIAPALKAQTTPPKQLVIAQTSDSTWQTDVIVWWPDIAPATWTPYRYDLYDCITRPASVTLNPGDVGLIRNAGDNLCTRPFALVAAPTKPSYSLLKFNGGAISFAVPPVGAITAERSARLTPIRNGDGFGTWLNLFVKSGAARVNVDVYDGENNLVARESVNVSGQVTQYKVATPVTAGSIVVSIRPTAGVEPVPVYGFASVSSTSGGNAVVIPIE